MKACGGPKEEEGSMGRMQEEGTRPRMVQESWGGGGGGRETKLIVDDKLCSAAFAFDMLTPIKGISTQTHTHLTEPFLNKTEQGGESKPTEMCYYCYGAKQQQ